jgi:hypothetical protein
MFRNSMRGMRDMYLATSPDGGRSWARSSELGSLDWEIAACPMDGGALGFDSSGGPVGVFRSGDRIYLTRGAASAEVAIGKNPWLAMRGATPIIVWQSGSGVYVQTGTDSGTRRRLSESGTDPVVVATKDGAIAAWRGTGAAPGVFVQRL